MLLNSKIPAAAEKGWVASYRRIEHYTEEMLPCVCPSTRDTELNRTLVWPSMTVLSDSRSLQTLPWNVRRTHLSFHSLPPWPFFPIKFRALHFSQELVIMPLVWREFCFFYHHSLHPQAQSGRLSSHISRDNDKKKKKVASLLCTDEHVMNFLGK